MNSINTEKLVNIIEQIGGMSLNKAMIGKINTIFLVVLVILSVWYHLTQQSSNTATKVREMLKVNKGTYAGAATSYMLYVLPILLINLYMNRSRLNKLVPSLLISLLIGTIWYSTSEPQSKLAKTITNKLNIREGSIPESLVSYVIFISPVLIIYAILMNTLSKRLI